MQIKGRRNSDLIESKSKRNLLEEAIDNFMNIHHLRYNEYFKIKDDTSGLLYFIDDHKNIKMTADYPNPMIIDMPANKVLYLLRNKETILKDYFRPKNGDTYYYISGYYLSDKLIKTMSKTFYDDDPECMAHYLSGNCFEKSSDANYDSYIKLFNKVLDKNSKSDFVKYIDFKQNNDLDRKSI